MEHNIRTEGDVTILELSGSLDVSCAPQLKDILQSLILERKYILVDLSKVDFIDSSGLGILVKAYQLSREGQIQLANPQSAVRKVFNTTGADSIFSIHNSVEEALESFKQEGFHAL